MRKTNIYYNKDFASELLETDDSEYLFTYDSHNNDKYPNQFITFTL